MGEYVIMIRFTDMSDFHQGYHFFMLRPSRAGSIFVVVTACTVLAAIVWAFVAKMDDIVKATALLRPATTISQVVALSGGELIEKTYVNDGLVNEGKLLMSFDAAADLVELENSKNLMERVLGEINKNEILLKTIQKNINATSGNEGEAFTRSEAYLIEYRHLIGQIEILEINLEREKTMPDSMYAAQRVEDIEKEIVQARLSMNLWRNNQLIDTTNTLKTLSSEKEALERRVSDLNRNIKNATIYAPISGKINEIRALNIGDNALPGEHIVDIIPSNSTMLKVELDVDPAYIALVKTGQKVSLRFPGLPPSKYGKLEGEINLVPADYIMRQGAKPVFIVEAQIAEPYLTSKNGERIYLRAGISAEGRIITSQDTVMYMILKKLDFMSSSMDLVKTAESNEAQK